MSKNQSSVSIILILTEVEIADNEKQPKVKVS